MNVLEIFIDIYRVIIYIRHEIKSRPNGRYILFRRNFGIRFEVRTADFFQLLNCCRFLRIDLTFQKKPRGRSPNTLNRNLLAASFGLQIERWHDLENSFVTSSLFRERWRQPVGTTYQLFPFHQILVKNKVCQYATVAITIDSHEGAPIILKKVWSGYNSCPHRTSNYHFLRMNWKSTKS